MGAIKIDARSMNVRAKPIESEEEARRIGEEMAERAIERVQLKLPA